MQLVRALVEGGPQVAVTEPAQTSIADTAELILAANPKRKGFMVQNTGTTVIKLTFGPTSPTQDAYHVAVKGGTAGNDGLGSLYYDSGWVGEVRAISSAAGGTLVLTEFTAGGPDWDRAADWGLA
jgi:hypothetical protein